MNNLKLLLKYIVGFIKLRNIQVLETFPILKSNKFKSLHSAKIFKSRTEIWDQIIGIFSNKYLIFSIIFINLFFVGITFVDWDSRFSIYFLPLLMVFSSIGIDNKFMRTKLS